MKKKIKVLLVIEENLFFIPEFLHDLLSTQSYLFKIKNIFIIKKIKAKQNINLYLIKNFFHLTIRELYLMLLLFLKKKIIQFMKKKKLEEIIKSFNIKYYVIREKISNYEWLIKKIAPDLIVNSGSLYFKDNIIKIPKYGCINRHSSVLPSCGGFFPVFFGIANNEPLGTTIHFMNKNIDQGNIIIQKLIPKKISKTKNVYKIYQKSFADSAKLISKAIELLLEKKFTKEEKVMPSYYTFPNSLDWNKFRSKNGIWV